MPKQTAAGAAGFTPFKVPTDRDDLPLVSPDGPVYRCNGCGGPVEPGSVLAEQVEDGMVVGLLAFAGHGGPQTHACGRVL